MPLIKHTQNDIEAFVNAASFLNQKRKEELLARLPDYYQRICSSFLLSESLAVDLLFLFPHLSNVEIQTCSDMLDEESGVFLQYFQENLSESERDDFTRTLENILHSSKRVLNRGSETLDQASEQKIQNEIEQEFSDQP